MSFDVIESTEIQFPNHCDVQAMVSYLIDWLFLTDAECTVKMKMLQMPSSSSWYLSTFIWGLSE